MFSYRMSILLLPALVLVLIVYIKTVRNTYGISTPVQAIMASPNEATTIINKLNSINSQIKSISYSNVQIHISTNPLQRLTGSLSYEKPNNFRMLVYSLLGKELDLGSNSTTFWFWSNRDPARALFYASHDDMHKTRLKPPFNPIWIMDSIGINEVDLNGAHIMKYYQGTDVFWHIYTIDKDATGQPVIRLRVIDESKMYIVSQSMIKDGVTICSTTIDDLEKVGDMYVPSKMTSHWYSENITIEWKLRDPSLNKTIHKYVMPNVSRKIDMAKD